MLIRRSNEHWHGLTVWLSHSGMDRVANLLDRLATRAARMERAERFRGAGQQAAGDGVNVGVGRKPRGRIG